MKLTFYRLSVFTSVLFLMLAIIWMFAPVKLLSGWGVEFSTEMGIIGRRAAALYAGIAVMCFFARNAEPSTGRTAIIYGMITACMILALLGVYEMSTKHASEGILAAVFIEIVLSLLFILVYRSGRRQSINQNKNPNIKSRRK